MTDTPEFRGSAEHEHVAITSVRPTSLMLSRVAAPPSSRATRSVARTERRKPRANERRYVGSCNELAGSRHLLCHDCGYDKDEKQKDHDQQESFAELGEG